MNRIYTTAASIAMAFWLTLPTPASALDSPATGRALAEQWCSSCHLVTPDQTRASADAPPFMTIAGRPEMELNRISSFLIDPHPKMPNFNLSRQAIADIVAYIRSLKK